MDKLTQVIDMIEHPEHYSESQIKEILQDEESRQTYLTMMEMRMAFDKFKEFPGKALNFVADGYSAYPLAKQQFELEENKEFNLTQVIGLTNENPVSKQFC